MTQFIGHVKCTLLEDDEGDGSRARWRLEEPVKFWSSLEYGGKPLGLITVPKGFVSDMASVPRLPVAWLLAGGVGNRAAIIHDYLYVRRLVPRYVADRVFAEALAASGVSAWRRGVMYLAVRWFGPRW